MVKQSRIQKINKLRKLVAKASNPKKARRTKANTKAKPRAPSGPVLSECASRYMHCLADASDPRGFGACIPKFPARPSQKVHALARFTATVGTGGFGFVYMMPSQAYDYPCCAYSTATYSSGSTNTFPVSSTSIGLNNTAIVYPGNLPYAGSSFTTTGSNYVPNVQGRILSATLKVTYTGKVTDMAGTFSCFQAPDHANLASMSVDAITGYQDVNVKRVTSQPCVLTVGPVAEEETEYQRWPGSTPDTALMYPLQGGSNGTSIDTSLATYGPAIGVVVLTGTPGATFYCEYFSAHEFIGKGPGSAATVNKVDVVGFEAVAAAAQSINTNLAAKNGKTALGVMKENIVIGLSGVSEGVAKAYNDNPKAYNKLGTQAVDWVMRQSLSSSQNGALRVQGG